MKFNAGEIASVIKTEIEGFRGQIQTSEVGRVVEVGDGIARVYGLATAMAGEMVEDDQVKTRLAAYCQELCAWSPITLRLLKRGMVSAMAGTDMELQLRYEVANIHRAFSSEDGKEARAAFLQKRKPVFKGK